MPDFKGARTRAPGLYGREHRQTRARLMEQLVAAGSGRCAERVCIKASRLITPAMSLALCHERSTGLVLGLGHAACNTHEAATYGGQRAAARKRARSRAAADRGVTALRW